MRLLVICLLFVLLGGCDGDGNGNSSDTDPAGSGSDTTTDSDTESGTETDSQGSDTTTSTDGATWVTIPAGSFWMGDEEEAGSSPLIEVSLAAFEIMKTEATAGEYKECVDDGACTIPSQESTCDPNHELIEYANYDVPGREEHPINCINWQQAVEFCEWAGGRLPSESEWEYVAGNPDQRTAYPWGMDAPICDHAVITLDIVECGPAHTAASCSKPLGNSELGLCDLIGNVSEWMADWVVFGYSAYPTDGTASDGGLQVQRSKRGAAFGDGAESVNVLDVYSRSAMEPEKANPFVGVRCVR